MAFAWRLVHLLPLLGGACSLLVHNIRCPNFLLRRGEEIRRGPELFDLRGSTARGNYHGNCRDCTAREGGYLLVDASPCAVSLGFCVGKNFTAQDDAEGLAAATVPMLRVLVHFKEILIFLVRAIGRW